MNLAERIGQAAIADRWPPELLAYFLNKVEAAGFNLHGHTAISWHEAFEQGMIRR